MQHPALTMLDYTPLQLMAVVDIAVKLQEEIWLDYKFKFCCSFICFMLTQELTSNEAIAYSRVVWNSGKEQGSAYYKFYCSMQELYIETLEADGGEDES